MFTIFKVIISDFSILITASYLFSKLTKKSVNSELNFFKKFRFGIYSGITGILLLIFSIFYNNEFMIDLRLVPIVISSFWVGGVSPFVASVIIGSGRYFYDFSDKGLRFFILYLFIGISQIFISKLFKEYPPAKRLFLIFATIQVPVILNFLSYSGNSLPNWLLIFASVSYNTVGIILNNQFLKDMEDRKVSYQKLEKASTMDYLTKIPNRFSFDNQLKKDLADQESILLFLLDINNFKKINDFYGHAIGDAVLIHFSAILNEHPQIHGRIYRLGGDEFAILLPKRDLHASIEDFRSLIKSLIRENPYIEEAYELIPLSTSVGIGISDVESNSGLLYISADKDLYQDKAQQKKT
ncbi:MULTISPECIES: GGDEF domain-containing protein [Carnobacterium]|nr:MULTISPECIES: GGDEF domain-containing protein [Carnobacterium]MDT1940181.1 GGDEF domain-containing protein [Carnobacterium divergens]MDT1942619.1 GGDEF domain-containing protein [Carnobacterium divergens]MDT1948425.1 GGDEF domain-containing protein [Carnobacterium divergens]MDT1963619.1 GGDEF domain-containing protein [Carnobacterium divergens]MDV8933591.1 GGDEF domain-containing protein [Carnobacterium sp.]